MRLEGTFASVLRLLWDCLELWGLRLLDELVCWGYGLGGFHRTAHSRLRHFHTATHLHRQIPHRILTEQTDIILPYIKFPLTQTNKLKPHLPLILRRPRRLQLFLHHSDFRCYLVYLLPMVMGLTLYGLARLCLQLWNVESQRLFDSLWVITSLCLDGFKGNVRELVRLLCVCVTSLLNVCHYDIIGLGLLLLRQGLDLGGCFLKVVHVVSCPLAQIVL